jgi:group I intron endonuclease
MKLNRQRDLNKSGIYCVRNILNNKVYIGKAKCIYSRMKDHITRLNKQCKDENIHLINSWHKYGKDNFEYFVLEYLELDNGLLKIRELYWMKRYNSLDRKFGYNLREDSSTGLIVSEETRERMRISRYKALENPEIKAKCSHTYWKDNPDKCKEMAKKVADLITIYDIYQYDKKTKDLIKIWKSVSDLINENPSYKRHNIYAVCSGEKPSMYGFIWKKVIKENKDIVRTT